MPTWSISIGVVGGIVLAIIMLFFGGVETEADMRRRYEDDGVTRQEIQKQMPPGCTYHEILRRNRESYHLIRCDGRPSATLNWRPAGKNKRITFVATVG